MTRMRTQGTRYNNYLLTLVCDEGFGDGFAAAVVVAAESLLSPDAFLTTVARVVALTTQFIE